jgi:hypothetical protein
VVVLVREAHALVDRLSDAPPGGAPFLIVDRIVDAGVQPGGGAASAAPASNEPNVRGSWGGIRW